MEPVIDVHTHILPGIDDGAGNMEETRELLKLAYIQGIRVLIATPHYHRGKYYVDPDGIRELAGRVQSEADKMFPDMHIYAGQELIYYNGVFDAVSAGKAVPLADSDCFLIEFVPDISYETIYQAVRQMVLMRYRPVLAHVERYPCLKAPGRIEELRKSGAYMQMNFDSLRGGFRQRREISWCRRMVLEGNIRFFGTDMHRTDFRPPDIEKSVKWIYDKCGKEQAKRLTVVNPMEILL
ncbi:hypothetical protein GPL15_11200 [Clostridium sp. MCC353]|uniref:CpsB/CapC family capsule biosynthesis tyrosine phosphatase n=1 Tax=Clostridium sp. MCC353 TaxID=2592646 RepID=UPI001C0286B9|nr:CpsB/CapC family capsule biosynthesis tyrosine phosphatase [Clostridium sp. MCC353]MBT9777068.1 hypothetical protein [Clostridium sp. MCC353]